MASSTDSHSTSHPKESGLQSMPLETHEFILKMAQIMEGTSKEDRQAILDALRNSMTQSRKSTENSAEDGDSISEAVNDGKEENLESLDKESHSVHSDSHGVIKTEAEEENFTLTDQGPYKNINGKAKEDDLAFRGQEPSEIKEMNWKAAQDHQVSRSNEVPVVQKQNQGVSSVKSKSKTDRGSVNDDSIHQAPDKERKNKDEEKVSIINSNVRYSVPDVDESKNKLETSDLYVSKKQNDMVASSDDEMPPSTPASGEPSSGSELSESPRESQTTDAPVSRGFIIPVESERPAGPSTVPLHVPAHQLAGIPYSQAEVRQSFKRDTSNERGTHENNLPTRTQKNSTSTVNYGPPAMQEPDLYKTPTTTSNLPARTQEYKSAGGNMGLQYQGRNDQSQITSETIRQPIIYQDYATLGKGQTPSSTKMSGFQGASLGRKQFSQTVMSTGFPYPGLNDTQFQRTPKMSSESIRTKDYSSLGRGQCFPASKESTALKGPGLNAETSQGILPARSLPIRTSKQEPVITTVSSSTSEASTVMIKPQDALSTMSTLPSIPLYYQPHIVMQDQLPVLVLRPVLAQDSSPQVSSDSKGLNLESIPLIFPLGSTSVVKGNIDDPQVQLKPVSSESDGECIRPFNKEELYFGAELVSGYASSVTESEVDEAPLRKPPRVDKKQKDTSRPPASRTTYESPYGRSSNKPYDWEFPPPNPFVDKYNSNAAFTGTSDTSSTVPTTLSQEARSLFNKQGARAKTTPRTNPFAPEIPPRTDIPELSRNDFNSIPKSMLASSDPPLQRTSGFHQESVGEVPRTHRRRYSSESMITLIESECEGESYDISDVVASQGNSSENSFQSRIFGPSSGSFFDENIPVSHSNSPVAVHPTSKPSYDQSQASNPRSQSESVTTNEKPKQTKPKLPGHVAPLWIPDNQINKCCCCHEKFNVIRRKHHCRGCGKIFCSACCSQLARLSYLQYRISRICVFCTNIIKDAVRAKKAEKLQNSQNTAKTKTPNTGSQTTGTGNQAPAIQSASPPYSTNQSTGNSSQINPPQVVHALSTSGQPNSLTYNDPVTGQLVNVPIVYQTQGASPGQTMVLPGQAVAQPGNIIPQNQVQGNTQAPSNPSNVYQPQATLPGQMVVAPGQTVTQRGSNKMQGNTQAPSQQPSTLRSSAASSVKEMSETFPEKSETSRKMGTQTSDFKLPLRPAGRIVSWKSGSFSSRLMLQERKKALAKDLKELPNGVTIQVADELQVIVKKIKVRRPLYAPYQTWCFCSNGFEALKQTEVVIIFELNPKEDTFPEEVLRIYKVILDLVKLGNTFRHSNFIAFNSPFLGTTENAAFLFADDSFTDKLPAICEEKTKVLYGILVKRPELEIAKYIPLRFLLRLGQETKCFPFPVVNSRDRAVVYDGIDAEDKFYHTCSAMNNYLKNSVPEALIQGLVVLKEDGKVILQIPSASQTAVVSLFDRLIVKAHQTATIPLSSDISPHIHEYKVFHQSVVTKEVSFAKSISLFRNPDVIRQLSSPSVTGLGFLILHLGATSSAMQNHSGGELMDDGAIVYLSKFHTQKLRQSLYEHSNCYFYLGDRFDIVHFELRWIQDQQQSQPLHHSLSNTSQTPTSKEEFPGTATIDVRHSGHTPELKKLANAGVGDVSILIRGFEDCIRRVSMEPLIMQANKMRAGEAKELVLRVSLKQGIKKWSIGPSNQPMSLIRSLQMALHAVTLAELHGACLELTFDVTIIKQ